DDQVAVPVGEGLDLAFPQAVDTPDDPRFRLSRLEQILVQVVRVALFDAFEGREELDRLVGAQGLELRREAVDASHDLPPPARILLRRRDNPRLHAGMTLEILLVERALSEQGIDRESLARDVVDDLAALVGAERPHALVEHVDVITPAAREDEAHGLFLEPEV